MRVIDLLNKIANKEEIPYSIKVWNIVFEYDVLSGMYVDKDGYLTHYINDTGDLMEKVEIPEDTPKKISTIPTCINIVQDDIKPRIQDIEIENCLHDIAIKINEFIDITTHDKVEFLIRISDIDYINEVKIHFKDGSELYISKEEYNRLKKLLKIRFIYYRGGEYYEQPKNSIL